MNRFVRVLTYLLAVVLVVWLAGSVVDHLRWRAGQARIAAVERQLRDSLPPGTHRSAAIAFLDARGIEHSSDGREVGAIARGMYQTTWVTVDLGIRFHFDAAGKLTRHEAYEV